MEYRLVVVQEARGRVQVSLASRPVRTRYHGWDEEFVHEWRDAGVSASGETIFEALAKLGRVAERVGEVRAGLRCRVGQVRS